MPEKLNTSFVLGYHGCDAKVADSLIAGKSFRPSRNDWDWLGHGIYFWEANPKRGMDFARELKRSSRNSSVEKPAVVGAIIDLGLCLDLTSKAGLGIVRQSHTDLISILDTEGGPKPENHGDGLRRNLDCAVLNLTHRLRKAEGKAPFDTVRSVFIEGDPLYPRAGFYEKTHIQICVCNPACIKGVFRVPEFS